MRVRSGPDATRQYPQPLRGVIFDMDGVLVQTEDLKARAHSAAVRRFGADVPPAFYETLMGRSHETVATAFMEAGAIAVHPEIYAAEFRREYEELLRSDLQVTPGLLVLLAGLVARNYLLAVVTSSPALVTKRILADARLDVFFPVIVSSDHVLSPKPAPDCYNLALAHLRLRPQQAVAIEDSEAGVHAAVNAGLRVIAVRHRLNERHNFDLAARVIDSFSNTQRVLHIIDLMFHPDERLGVASSEDHSHADDRSHH